MDWETAYLHQKLPFFIWFDQMWCPMFQTRSSVRNLADRRSFWSQCAFFWHFRPETATTKSSGMPCSQDPKILQIPRKFAYWRPHMTKNQTCCRFQVLCTVQAAVPRVTWIEEFWAPKARKNCRKLPQKFHPNAVNCREACQGPSQCRHLKQKKAPLFRNVGETWAKRGWKRGRNGLEPGIPGGMVWFWDFCWHQGPEARKHCMETHSALPDVHISSTGSPPECFQIAGVQDLL